MSMMGRTSLLSLSVLVCRLTRSKSGSVSVGKAVHPSPVYVKAVLNLSSGLLLLSSEVLSQLLSLKGELPSICRWKDQFNQICWFLCLALSQALFVPSAILECHVLSEQVYLSMCRATKVYLKHSIPEV